MKVAPPSIAQHLCWPWSPEKCFPFSSTFDYIGFAWDLHHRTIQLPQKKKEEYLGSRLITSLSELFREAGRSEFELRCRAHCLFWACLNLVIIYLGSSVSLFSIFWSTLGYYNNALEAIRMF
jgi:hypothetical protein